MNLFKRKINHSCAKHKILFYLKKSFIQHRKPVNTSSKEVGLSFNTLANFINISIDEIAIYGCALQIENEVVLFNENENTGYVITAKGVEAHTSEKYLNINRDKRKVWTPIIAGMITGLIISLASSFFQNVLWQNKSTEKIKKLEVQITQQSQLIKSLSQQQTKTIIQ